MTSLETFVQARSHGMLGVVTAQKCLGADAVSIDERGLEAFLKKFYMPAFLHVIFPAC